MDTNLHELTRMNKDEEQFFPTENQFGLIRVNSCSFVFPFFPRYPFTAPLARPAMKSFCRMKKRIATGTMDRSVPAIRTP